MADLYTPDQAAVFQNMDPEKRAMLQALALRNAQSGPGRVVQQEPTPMPQQQISAAPVQPATLGDTRAEMLRMYGSGAQQNSPLLNDIDSRIGLALKNRQPRPQVEYPSAYTPEMVKSITDRLRRNEAFGAGFQMFGDDRAADLGKMLMSGPNADEFAQEVARQEQVRRYQQDQMNMGRGADEELSVLLETRRALDGGGVGGGDYQNVHAGSVENLLSGAMSASTVNDLANSYEDRFQQVLGKYQTILSDVPRWFTSNGVEEVLAKASNAGASEQELNDIRDSVLWFSRFKQDYELPKLQAQFGAALTADEWRRWREAMVIDPSTDPAVVKRKLADIQNYAAKFSDWMMRFYSPIYGADKVVPAFGALSEMPLKRGAATGGQSGSVGSGEHERLGRWTVK